jgi:hypothetical protein
MKLCYYYTEHYLARLNTMSKLYAFLIMFAISISSLHNFCQPKCSVLSRYITSPSEPVLSPHLASPRSFALQKVTSPPQQIQRQNTNFHTGVQPPRSNVRPSQPVYQQAYLQDLTLSIPGLPHQAPPTWSTTLATSSH